MGNPRIGDGVVDMGAHEMPEQTHIITTAAGVNGSIIPENPPVFEGYNKTFSIQPAAEYHVDSLTVDGSPVSVALSYTFTNVQSVHTISATFAINMYALTVENGSGDGSYTNGEVISISADTMPVEYEFFGWITSPSGYTNRVANTSATSTTFTMPPADVTVIANYLTGSNYVDAARPDDSGDGLSWATAKKTIQAAVDVVRDDGTVWVTNGVYDTGGAVTPGYSLANRVCITKPVTVRSVNGAEVTSIKGAGPIGNSAIRGVFISNGGSLIGFTVTNGYTKSSGSLTVERSGGGVAVAGDGVVSNCILRGNSAHYYGGGARLNNGGALNNCILIDNLAVNAGAGACLSEGGELNNCMITGNSAGSSSGGVFCWNGGTVNNCTLSGNSANSIAGGVRLYYGGVLNNSIVWNNTAPSEINIRKDGSGNIIRHTCASDGLTHGVDGCITNNPLFQNAANSNYQLQVSSPCINTGSDVYAPTNVTPYDLAGNSRINGAVDMGAYENTSQMFMITTTPSANGSITPENSWVIQGENKNFIIQPELEYRIDSLTVDGTPVSVASGYTFTNVQSSHTIAATFVVDPHMLTVENGSGDGTYVIGTEIPVSADEAVGESVFSYWAVDPMEFTNRLADAFASSTTFIMPATNVTLTANYRVPSTYYVDASRPDDSGSATNWTTAKKTIQAAVDLATAGDIVLVTNGVYNTGGAVAPVYIDEWGAVTNSLMSRVCITNAITIRGVNGADVTIIRGASHEYPGSNGVSAVRCAYLLPGAVLEGFTLTDGHTFAGTVDWFDNFGGGAFLFTNAVLNNCVLSENSARYLGGGAFCLEGGTLNNCVLNKNSSECDAGGAFGGTLNNCILSENSAGYIGGGALLVENGTLNNCTVTENLSGDEGGGVLCTEGGTLNNCIVWGNSSPDGSDIKQWGTETIIRYTCASDGVTNGVNGCITDNPLFLNPNGNYRLQQNSPCIDAGLNDYAPEMDIIGVVRPFDGDTNGVAVADMGCYEWDSHTFSGVYYVDASRLDDSGNGFGWSTAKQTIQAAVDLTSDGDMVLVTNGVYNTGGTVTPVWGSITNGLTNRVCITNAITVQSVNGADVTLIKGAPGSNGNNDLDSVRGVFLNNGGRLTGFTITNGYTMSRDSSLFDRSGGGIWLETNCVVSNCMLSGNSAGDDGGGAFAYYGGTLNNCVLTGNDAGGEGGGVSLFRAGTLNNCTLSGNSSPSYGGGAHLYQGGTLVNCALTGNIAKYASGVHLVFGGTLNNCTLTGNSRDGAYLREGGTLNDCTLSGNLYGAYLSRGGTLNNCTLTGNSRDGAFLREGGTLNNCALSGNLDDGAALYRGGTLNNCTSTGNAGDGAYLKDGGLLNNCIAWGNATDIRTVGVSNIIRNTCASIGVTHGMDGCITNNPLFVDGVNSNFQLQADSPCINSGHNSCVTTTNDLANNPRILGGVVDMGAYESPELPTYIITTDAGANGSITPNNPPVFEGYNKTFSIQPVFGYYINSLTVDGSPVSETSTYTFTNVQATHTIAATFATDPHALTVENGSGNGSYIIGTEVSVSADAATEGYRFFNWTALPSEYTNHLADAFATSTTFTMPPTNVTLTANYILPQAYVDASRPDDSGGGGSWATAKKTIQAAVDAVMSTGTVWVTNGVYDTDGAVTPSYRVCITQPIRVRSINGPDVTIIKGAPGSNGSNDVDSVRGVYMESGCSLIGFTVANGYTKNNSGSFYDRCGAGVFLMSGGIVSNCTLSGNVADASGGGAYFLLGGTLSHCRLTGNKADSGGGFNLNSYGTLNNCTVSGNTAVNGGGAYMFEGGTLNNCTLTGNEAIDSGGGALLNQGGTLNNCVVWGNFANDRNDLEMQWGGSSSIRYTCASDGVTNGVNGCITNNPLFVDAVNSNFQLQANSPCINAGLNSYVSSTNDFVGNPRIVGGVVDMGAVERQDADSDVDDDGMADLWEMNHLNGRHAVDPDTVCSNGINTVREAYIAGLDPNDPNSKFLTSVLCPPSSGSILQWNTASGRVYSVWWTTNLLDGFQPLETNLPWTAHSFTDSVHGAHGYYKINVELE